ncbi:MAG: hypothetical protein IJ191_09325, partial [Treponema sp.]|nr:hypothetical protein [Treponema sp.]
MKQKPNQPSADNPAALFWTAVVLCICGAIISLLLFFLSYFRAVMRRDQLPIATITFKYKTAQRKFIDRVVWDRLYQSAPVYNGDTIATSAFSEATVRFVDGNVMELHENTMAQVFMDADNVMSAHLENGSAVVDASDAVRGMSFGTEDMQVAIDHGSAVSALSFGASGGSMDAVFQVLSGVARVGGTALEAGEEFFTGQGVHNRSSVVVTCPAREAKVLYHTEGAGIVPFTWRLHNMPAGTPLHLELAADSRYET